MSARSEPLPSLTVAVFAFDEEQNIGPVLTELRQWLREHEPRSEILVIDDGSRDATAAVAERTLRSGDGAGICWRVLRHTENRGIGAAIKTAAEAARGKWMTFVPADGQIPPSAIGTLRDAAATGDVDVVLSVYRRRDDGWHRKALSAGVRTLILLVHGTRVHSDGPYLFRRPLLDPRQLHSDSFFLNFEFPIRVRQAGLRTRTVTIDCRRRRAGRSKSTPMTKILHVAGDLVDLRLRLARDGLTRGSRTRRR